MELADSALWATDLLDRIQSGLLRMPHTPRLGNIYEKVLHTHLLSRHEMYDLHDDYGQEERFGRWSLGQEYIEPGKNY